MVQQCHEHVQTYETQVPAEPTINKYMGEMGGDHKGRDREAQLSVHWAFLFFKCTKIS